MTRAGCFPTNSRLTRHTGPMEHDQTYEEHAAELEEYSEAIHDPATTAAERSALEQEEAAKPLGPDEEI